MLLVSALLLLGCGTMDPVDAGDDLAGERDEREAKADGVTWPVGTYRATDDSGDISTLVLKTDGTFHLERRCAAAMPCAQQAGRMGGTYKFTRTSGSRYILLFPIGQDLVRYSYRLGPDGLLLRHPGSGAWSRLQRAERAWCAGAYDCTLQNLSFPRCTGDVACQQNACSVRCG
jgi:hypothetical protein